MKHRLFYAKSRKASLPPGTLVFTGERKAEHAELTLIDYSEDHYHEITIEDIETCFKYRDTASVTWINIDGLHDLELIEKLGIHFGIHPLILEDIVNIDQRPKVDDMDSILYVVLQMVSVIPDQQQMDSEQVSLILGPHFLITFQERPGDVFKTVRERIRHAGGRIRKMGPDYLAYALIDAIVDHYFIVLEHLGDGIEKMEEEVLSNPSSETMQRLHETKRMLLYLRKSAWPLREMVSHLEKSESPIFKKTIRPFLRDLYDHTVQIIDMLETMREINTSLFDLYLSSVSNKMNEVMKVLTVIATIFIPLTFIAGIYGMNFEYMPELQWPWAYFGIWGVMIAVFAGMVLYFKRKRWF